jgi:hypothetical protein
MDHLVTSTAARAIEGNPAALCKMHSRVDQSGRESLQEDARVTRRSPERL